MKRLPVMTREDDFDNGYWEENYNEYDEVYQNALTTVRIIDENRRLKRENQQLRRELEDSKNYLNEQYKYSMSQVGSILGTLLKDEIKD